MKTPRDHGFLIPERAHLRDLLCHNFQNDHMDCRNTEEAGVVVEDMENRVAAAEDRNVRNELLLRAEHHVACAEAAEDSVV